MSLLRRILCALVGVLVITLAGTGLTPVAAVSEDSASAGTTSGVEDSPESSGADEAAPSDPDDGGDLADEKEPGGAKEPTDETPGTTSEQAAEEPEPIRPRGPAPQRIASSVALEECTPVPLQAWGVAPSVAGVRNEDANLAECYSVTTGASGSYVPRLVTQNQSWTPLLTVYEADGDYVWSGWNYLSSLPVLQLKGATQYRFEVSGNNSTLPGDYRIGLHEVLGGECATLPTIGWDAEPVALTVTRGAVDCRQFTAPTGRTIRLESRTPQNAHAMLRVVNAAGTHICSVDGAISQACTLTGAGPYRVVGTSAVADESAELGVGVVDTESTDGCTTVGLAAWGGTLPVVAQRRADGTGFECYAVTAPRAGRFLLRSRMDSDRWSPITEVWESGSGTRIRYDGGTHDLLDLDLREARTYRIVVSGNPDGYDRGYALGLFDLRGEGCAPVASLAWDAEPLVHELSAGGVGCALVTSEPGTPLRLQSELTGPEGTAWSAVYNAAGTRLCDVRTGQAEPCTVTGSGPYRVVTRGDGRTAVVEQQLHVTDVRSQQGCTTAPLASFSSALPVVGQRRLDGLDVDCYVVTTSSSGQHVLRAWFASQSWSPRVELWDEAQRVASRPGWEAGYYLQGIGLRPDTSYRLLVSGDPDGHDRGYRLGLLPMATGGGCSTMSDLTWAATAQTGSTAEGEVDCREVAAEPGTTTWLRLNRAGELGSPAATMVNKAGETLCVAEQSQSVRCRLSGAAPFRLLVHDRDGRDAAGWRARVSDLAVLSGCQDVSANLAMDGTPVTGTLPSGGAESCLGLPGSVNGDTLFGTLRAAQGASVGVVNADGNQVCAAGADQPGWSCQLTGPAPYRLVLSTTSAFDRDFRLLLREPVAGPACTSIPTVAYGFDPLSGKSVEDLAARCFSFEGTLGDQLRLRTTGLDGNPRPDLFVFSPNGTLLCSSSYRWWWNPVADCTSNATGKHVALVVPDSTSMGRFELSGECLNPACGPDQLTVLGATPRQLGQAPSTTVTVQGKNFDKSQDIELYRGETVIPGTMIEVAEDRRTARAVFDLASAAQGAWNIRVSASDGSVATYPDAVTVVAAGDPEISAQVTGLGRFVPGRPQTMSLTVTNSGNVDGIGVPVFLDGLPAGTTVEPQFEIASIDGQGNPGQGSFDSDADMYTRSDGKRGLAFFVNRIPAGATAEASFRINVPTAENFEVTPVVTGCVVDTTQLAESASARAGALPTGTDCLTSMWMYAYELGDAAMPFGGCVDLVQDAMVDGMMNWADTGNPLVFSNFGDGLASVANFAWNGVSCAADFFPASKALKVAAAFVEKSDLIWDSANVALDCVQDMATLAYDAVASLDPNEMVGPAGGGEDRAFRGEGRQHYAVYFENSKDATAPAQVVTIDSDLDADLFDMSTLTFGGLSFGNTIWKASEDSAELDHTLDLVSDEGLQLRVRATKDDDGTLQWVMETLDPVTGELPEDPFLGFLPPNDNGTEGQGVVYFDVAYRDTVDTGDVVPAQATIVFDLNEPIVTNTWSNLIDRDAPTANVVDLPAETGQSTFGVDWESSDPTSDVSEVRVYSAQDGGDYQLWQTGQPVSGADFDGEAGHSYAFAAIAVDAAGNQSALPSVPHASTDVLFGTVAFEEEPSLNGTFRVGRELAVDVPATVPTGADTAVTWLRDGQPIAGATGPAYTLTKADLGAVVGARVTAELADYADGSVLLPGAKVAAGKITYAKKYALSGKPAVGSTVKAAVVTSKVRPATATVAYQWFAGTKAIKKATKSAFKVTSKEIGKKLWCRATLSAPGYAKLVLSTKSVKVTG